MRAVHGRRWASIGVLLVIAAACAGPADTEASAIRAELRTLIEDVAGSTAHHYGLRDTDGRDMGPTTVIWSPEAQQFAGIYASWDEAFGGFVVHLATSDDLMTWQERKPFAVGASQPTMTRTPSGRYVLAWEQEPDPIHLELLEFDSWEALVNDGATPRFLAPAVTMPACGEGTPDLTRATDDRVELSFHYHAGCARDLQANGWTDWIDWHPAADPDLDAIVEAAGVPGHIGDRTSFTYRGREFMVIEGETVPGDWASWRLFLYDPGEATIERLDIRTDGGSRAFSNPAVEIVSVDGRPSLLVTMFLFSEGAAAGESGGLLYYRTLPDNAG